jgi:hypothetical protein
MPRSKDHEPVESARTPITVRPPFDPAQYARDSERELEASEERSASRPTTPPPQPALDLRADTMLEDWVPQLAVPRAELEWMDLKPLACTLLLRVNGCSTVKEIAEASSIGVGEASRVFEKLARKHVVRWR